MKRKKNKKSGSLIRLGLWGGVILILTVTILIMVRLASPPSQEPLPPQTPLVLKPSITVEPGDWVKGNRDAPTILVEYSDFQCPACRAFAPLVKQLYTELGDHIAIVYRHFPLSRIHPHAQIAAQSAEAAGKQGKFWEMHDLIFDHQEEWSNEEHPKDFFENYAKELLLDLEKFQQDFDSQSVKQSIRENVQSGVILTVEGTPTFFLNGKKINNPRSYGAFRALILNEMDNPS